MQPDESFYHELMAYTLELRDSEFVHQHVVDAYAAQNAEKNSKPMGIVFALIGLYLHVEKEFTGRQVQRVHMQLARQGKQWPRMDLPEERGQITVADVVGAPAGQERNAKIEAWCASVWDAWRMSRGQIVELTERELGLI